MKKITLRLIVFYQRFISSIGGKKCRYHPTCSEFALWQLDHNNFFKAIYFTIFRILRCNQLFDGGFDYPIISNFKISPSYTLKPIIVKYWIVPTNNNKFLIIKNINWEKLS